MIVLLPYFLQKVKSKLQCDICFYFYERERLRWFFPRWRIFFDTTTTCKQVCITNPVYKTKWHYCEKTIRLILWNSNAAIDYPNKLVLHDLTMREPCVNNSITVKWIIFFTNYLQTGPEICYLRPPEISCRCLCKQNHTEIAFFTKLNH